MKFYGIFHLIIFIAFFACGSQNSSTQNSNPIIPDHFDLPLNYKVKLNGSTEVKIRYTDNKNELHEITIGLGDRGGIQEFIFDFNTPADVHYISATVPKSDSLHTFLFVSTEDFTTNGKYFVEISY